MTAEGDVTGAATAPRGTPVAGPDYVGRPGEIARMMLGVGLLNLLTLGLYRFWGTTRLRRYLWENVRFEGDQFEYTGRGSELFIGFLIVIAILVPLFAGQMFLDIYLAAAGEFWQSVANGVYLLLIIYLVHVATYRARRYRLSRTVWRGIRGGQSGSSWTYGLKALGWSVLSFVTLGLAFPVQRTRLQQLRSRNTWLGDVAFDFHAEARKLFVGWLVTWLLLVPTLGLSYLWYRAREFRYFAESTAFAGLNFRSALRGRDLILIFLPYLAALVAVFIILGFGVTAITGTGLRAMFGEATGATAQQQLRTFSPYLAIVIGAWFAVFLLVAGILKTLLVTHRLTGLLCRTLGTAGDLDHETITKARHAAPRFGEGLADALDVGGI